MDVNKKKKRVGEHGAVSVFLAIILVPCMVFTCVFTDLGRVHLSKAVTESASDLALYSLLSHYDENLKEYYGLVGSCQTIDDFYTASENYFMGMLQAEGVPDEGSQLFLSYLHELQNEGYSDFLRVDLSDVEVTCAQESAMGENPALIEDGIVEFMKYRGPVSIGTRLIDRFSSLDMDSTMDQVNNDKKVSDAKQKYAEAQGDLLKMAFYSYLAIQKYDKVQANQGVPSAGTYALLEENLSDIRDDLRGITSLITKYYYPGTEKIRSVVFPSFSVASYHCDPEDIGEKIEKEDGEVSYGLDRDTLEDIMENLDSNLESMDQAANSFLESCSSIPSPQTGVNNVVYCMKMQEAIDASQVITIMDQKGDAVLKTYAKLEAASECEPMEDLPEDWEEKIADAQEKIDKAFYSYLNKNGSSNYLTKVGEYERTAMDTVPKVQNRTYTFTSQYTGHAETISSFSSSVSGMIAEIVSNLDLQIHQLDIAIDGGTLDSGTKVDSLNELKTAADEFRSSRNEWGNMASAYKDSSDYAEKEYKMYSNAEHVAQTGRVEDDKEAEGEAIAAQITEESVTELQDRLVHIRTDMQQCLDAINDFTYGGINVKELKNDTAFLQAAYTIIPANQSFSMSEAENKAGQYFDNLINPKDGAVFTAPNISSSANGNDPDLNRATPTLYRYMKEQLQDDEDQVEDMLKENDAREKEYDQKEKDAKAGAEEINSEYVENKGNDIVDSSGGNTVSLLSGLDSVVTIADNILNGSGDELRDQLYVCEYIMDMFSYSSFDNEGKYRLVLDGFDDVEANENVTWKDFPYNAAKEIWETEDPRSVMGNQSLTNIPIVSQNNHANLGEVEYILYGKSSIDENLKSSYKNIFAIREMMNTVSGFCNFYGNTTITSIATAVSAATYGIVPVPVTKCVLILVLATLESAKDLERLKAGGRVELYKSTASDWVYQVGSLSSLAADFSEKNVSQKEKGLYYSDYMYIFLLIGLTSEKTYDSMLLRIGDLIQANMRLMIDNEEYTLANTKSYFQLTATVRVKPLMLTLPIVNTVEGASDLQSSTDWCTYSVHAIRGYS